MSDRESDIEGLLSETRSFMETKAELWKLKGVDSITTIISTLVSGGGVVLLATFAVFMFSIALALVVGRWLGSLAWGFFLVGSLYGLASLISYVFRNSWMKSPVQNTMIRELLK